MTKTAYQLLNEGKPFCLLCGQQRQVDSADSAILAVDLKENHLETCSYWRKLVLEKELQKHQKPELVYEALNCLEGMSPDDWKAIGDDLFGLGGQPAEIIKKVETHWAPQFGRC